MESIPSQELKKIGFKQSKVDECVFYKGKFVYALYTDDSILERLDPTEIDNLLKQMRKTKLYIIEEGTLEIFLGVNIDRKPDGSIHLTQARLIENILGDLNLLGSGE